MPGSSTFLSDAEYRGLWHGMQHQENHVCTRQVSRRSGSNEQAVRHRKGYLAAAPTHAWSAVAAAAGGSTRSVGCSLLLVLCASHPVV